MLTGATELDRIAASVDALGATPAGVEVRLAERIRTTERDRLRAIVEADVDVLDHLHGDAFQLINPGGGR